MVCKSSLHSLLMDFALLAASVNFKSAFHMMFEHFSNIPSILLQTLIRGQQVAQTEA